MDTADKRISELEDKVVKNHLNAYSTVERWKKELRRLEDGDMWETCSQ